MTNLQKRLGKLESRLNPPQELIKVWQIVLVDRAGLRQDEDQIQWTPGTGPITGS